ncbi:hypothetical protein J1614_005551 [Plenodomus biglobosus]|nr:hypothetical protein J1614_005551 [Plenodomus biglobosus]
MTDLFVGRILLPKIPIYIYVNFTSACTILAPPFKPQTTKNIKENLTPVHCLRIIHIIHHTITKSQSHILDTAKRYHIQIPQCTNTL